MFNMHVLAISTLTILSCGVEALPHPANSQQYTGHYEPSTTSNPAAVTIPPAGTTPCNYGSRRPIDAPRAVNNTSLVRIRTAITHSTDYSTPTISSHTLPSLHASLRLRQQKWNGTQDLVPSALATAPSRVVSADTLDSIRGVNIGNWLILEKWMDTDNLFSGDFANATDQWSFDSIDGAADRLISHWESYFTEEDVKKIASWGINTLRIPIGYWAYNNSGTPFTTGSDAYLEKAISWARESNLKVLIDCHGSPGSQNGYQNSGHTGAVSWQTGDNLETSITVLEFIAQKYGSAKYADVVMGLELVNEPISWGPNNFNTTKRWAEKAYTAVRAASLNKDLVIVMHDSFMGPGQWQDVSEAINSDTTDARAKFAIDAHFYQNQEDKDKTLTQAQHIQDVCTWTQSTLRQPLSNMPVYIGELSAATDICVNPDGSTIGGTVCFIDGCQCSANLPIQYWGQNLIQATRQFFEAELDAFERSSNGWFMWSYKGPGAWGLDNAVKYGLIGKTVSERMFPSQCNF